MFAKERTRPAGERAVEDGIFQQALRVGFLRAL